jgi:hypothetical protein
LLTPVGGLTLDMIKNKVARFIDAIMRDKTAHTVIEDVIPEDYVGKWVKGTLKHEPAKDGYEAKNVISGYSMITDSDNFNEPVF